MSGFHTDENYPRRALHKRSAANDIDLNCNEQILKAKRKSLKKKKENFIIVHYKFVLNSRTRELKKI